MSHEKHISRLNAAEGDSPASKAGLLAGPVRLRGLNAAQMTAFFQHHGHPAYRARQVFDWVYAKGAESIEDMTNLPRAMRAWLGEAAALGGLELVECVGEAGETQKMVLKTDDGELIESVLMRDEFVKEEDFADAPADKGSTPAKKKVSLCVSSQVGCALGCAFCMTGLAGFRRDLRTDEILDQVLVARRLTSSDERIANIVYMGMGEPMLNVEPVVDSLRVLTAPDGLGVSTRRVTVSTAGVLEGMEAFARAKTEANLAVSLNAADQETRDRIMPGLRRWPLEKLLALCRRWPLTKRRRITFEYVLLKGVNDRDADRVRLARMLRGIACKINLIVYNPDESGEFEPTGDAEAEAFRRALADDGHTASLRRSKGRRHCAACGQLAGHAKPPGPAPSGA